MLKKSVLILVAGVVIMFSASCSRDGKNDDALSTDVVQNPNTADGKVDLSKLPVMKFREDVHDFGKIIEGETVAFDFKFTNTGKSDLIIADVSTSCGCTVPTYPRTPIHPGEEGTIKVTFNSVGRRGYQTKNILVVANTQPNTIPLKIKAQVGSPGSEQ